MALFDVHSQVAFYRSYHNNKTNQLIHLICVPLIVWASAVLLAKIPLSFIPSFDFYGVNIANLSTIIVGIYAGYYILLEPVAGALYAPILVFMWWSANRLLLTNPNATTIAIGVEVVCWALQFVGHGVFEGRRPALIDNLMQSLVLAPLFVWLEVMFHLGYKPSLARNIERTAHANIAAMKKKLAAVAKK